MRNRTKTRIASVSDRVQVDVFAVLHYVYVGNAIIEPSDSTSRFIIGH